MSLTFQHFAAVNRSRCLRLHEGAEPWLGVDWSNAMGGESGEAQNLVKKLRRIETNTDQSVNGASYDELVDRLGAEIADVMAYAFLLADHYGINVEAATVAKFNAVSEGYGVPERLP